MSDNSSHQNVLQPADALGSMRHPVVFERDGEVFANSRDVAAYFAKDHNHVLRDIDKLVDAEPNLGLSKFGQTSYAHPQNGQTYRSYDMTRDGFALLAMGFTGGKALRWRIAYIEAFNLMEANHREVLPVPAVIQAVTSEVMKAIGGMMKGIVMKAISEVLPAMVQSEIAGNQYGVVKGVTAGSVIVMAGVTQRKGTRGLARRVSDQLRRFHAARGAVVKLAELGMRTAYVFDPGLCREWLMTGGKEMIERLIAEKRGQGVLRLVPAG